MLFLLPIGAYLAGRQVRNTSAKFRSNVNDTFEAVETVGAVKKAAKNPLVIAGVAVGGFFALKKLKVIK